MQISVATATYYFLPFEKTLEIIANAGFEYIELDMYWKGGRWEVAQHIKGMKVKEVVRLIDESGLKVSSIHDAGAVMSKTYETADFINHQLDEYLDELGYAPGCIVFHTPHREGEHDEQWSREAELRAGEDAARYQTEHTAVTVENMPQIAGYFIPICSPQELLDFVSKNGLGVTIDTAHYAQDGIDIVQAAGILGDTVKTVHVGDYAAGSGQRSLGEGEIDFTSFFGEVDTQALHSVTIECPQEAPGEDAVKAGQAGMIKGLKAAKGRLSQWIESTHHRR